MDMLNFVLAIVMIIIALQYNQTWIVFALIILSILSFKSLRVSLALIISAVAVYFLLQSSDLLENFPLIIVGLLIVALILGVGNKPQEASPYGADMFGGMGGGGYDDFGGGAGGGMA